MQLADVMIDRGLVPEPLLRHGVRLVLCERLAEQRDRAAGSRAAALARFVEHMRESPIALAPAEANAQHYEVPVEFYALVLGERRKYSSAYYVAPEVGLDEAERAMLSLTVERARIADGMDVLELGCGWGHACFADAEFARANSDGLVHCARRRSWPPQGASIPVRAWPVRAARGRCAG
jgi:hypothetical protein